MNDEKTDFSIDIYGWHDMHADYAGMGGRVAVDEARS